MMLCDIARNHSEYIKMALYYTKDMSLAQDVVQDMYLKLAVQQQKRGNLNHIEFNGKPSPQYIFRIIRSVYLDTNKIESRYVTQTGSIGFTEPVEPFLINDWLRKFPWYEKRLTEVYFKHGHSIRSLSKMTTISKTNIYLTLRKTKTYIKNLIENDYKETK